jgi:hypothetical protein
VGAAEYANKWLKEEKKIPTPPPKINPSSVQNQPSRNATFPNSRGFILSPVSSPAKSAPVRTNSTDAETTEIASLLLSIGNVTDMTKRRDKNTSEVESLFRYIIVYILILSNLNCRAELASLQSLSNRVLQIFHENSYTKEESRLNFHLQAFFGHLQTAFQTDRNHSQVEILRYKLEEALWWGELILQSSTGILSSSPQSSSSNNNNNNGNNTRPFSSNLSSFNSNISSGGSNNSNTTSSNNNNNNPTFPNNTHTSTSSLQTSSSSPNQSPILSSPTLSRNKPPLPNNNNNNNNNTPPPLPSRANKPPLMRTV